jgi:hypothetical protein
LGQELNDLKEQCIQENKDWLPVVEKTGIPPRTANRWMLKAYKKLHPESDISQMADGEQAREEIPEREPGDESPRGEEDPVVRPESVFCPRCQRVGPAKNCQACLDLRGRKPKTQPTERPKEKPKNGKPVFDWKLVEEPFGKLVRSLDLFGNAFGCKESPAVEAIRKKFEEAHKDLKDLYQQRGKNA